MKAIEFVNITKTFGNAVANDNISFSIEKNSVHCILGENGAGKSTLMKILFGVHKPDGGYINFNGNKISFKSPHDSIANNIGMLFQHFMLIDDFTIRENVILGNEISTAFKLDTKQTDKILNELIVQYNLGLDLNDKISDISISQQQKVEILKLLYRNSDVIIFDEPTAVLTPIETEKFFEIIRKFKSEGKTIILITHKLNEVKEISDKVTVLRKGKVVYETTQENLDIQTLSRQIVGDIEYEAKSPTEKKETSEKNALALQDVYFEQKEVYILNGITLVVKCGEIHGIAGVEGNGQNEIIDIIFGLKNISQGDLNKISNDVALVPDDRIKKGMVEEFTIGENFLLRSGNKKIITNKISDEITENIVKKYNINLLNIGSNMGSLSGGNQQRVIVAREIEMDSDIMILSHPTRGVDINATEIIHSEIISQRNSGKAILLVSSDLDELLLLSDRLSIIYRGKILRTFSRNELEADTDEQKEKLAEQISKYMLGITK